MHSSAICYLFVWKKMSLMNAVHWITAPVMLSKFSILLKQISLNLKSISFILVEKLSVLELVWFLSVTHLHFLYFFLVFFFSFSLINYPFWCQLNFSIFSLPIWITWIHNTIIQLNTSYWFVFNQTYFFEFMPLFSFDVSSWPKLSSGNDFKNMLWNLVSSNLKQVLSNEIHLFI